MGRWYPNTSTSSIQNFFMSSRKMFVTTKRLRSWEKHSDLNRLSYESCNLFWSRMHQDIFQLINIHLGSHTLTLIDTNVLVRWCTRHHFIENEKAPHTYLLIEFFSFVSRKVYLPHNYMFCPSVDKWINTFNKLEIN